jgi:hypothetical protein
VRIGVPAGADKRQPVVESLPIGGEEQCVAAKENELGDSPATGPEPDESADGEGSEG